jgi:flagellar protein FlaI
MPEITIVDLVRNGTLNAEMAAVLWAAVDERQSFLTVAVPRFAGKTTTSNAILAMRPPDMPAYLVAGEPEVMDRLTRERLGGYLVVAEFAPAPVPGYIWGAPVRRVFEAVHTGGYALQTALHAPGVDEAIVEVTHGNGVSDEQASIFKLVIYIERFGTSLGNYWRRITDLYEVREVRGGHPVGQSLFQWRADGDRFEKLSEPSQFGLDRPDIARRAALIDELVETGSSSSDEVQSALATYRNSILSGGDLANP